VDSHSRQTPSGHTGHHGDNERLGFCPRCAARLEDRVLKSGEPARLVCAACEYVLFLDPKVATGCIAEIDGGIVLVRRSIEPGYGKWVFPGGYVDRGERVEQAAVREMREESGVEVSVVSLLGVYSYEYRPIVVIVYVGHVSGGKLTAADESLEAMTFAPDNLPWNELAFPSTFEALRDYIQQRYAIVPPDGILPPLT
jgi:mutator protein MutT